MARSPVDAPIETQQTARQGLSSDASAPKLANPKQAEQHRYVGNELPSEVHEAWAGQYKLLHGRICLRSRGRVSAQEPEGELISTWYNRGVILTLSAVDAHRFYHLGVIMRCDEDGDEVSMPPEISNPKQHDWNTKQRFQFNERDEEAKGNRAGVWG